MSLSVIKLGRGEGDWRPTLGAGGHLALFIWLMVMAMLVSGRFLFGTSMVFLLVIGVVYPNTLKKLFRWRWLVWILLMAIPMVFFIGEVDASWMGIHYSTDGMAAGLQIAIRFVVMLAAVQGFTSSVDIPTLAGVLERFGLKGLGFSVGVALNMLPAMQAACLKTWRTMQMRGGFRKHRWRTLQLLVITVMANALRRAEDIALAAEARAYSPEKSRPMPVNGGTLDWFCITGCVLTPILMLLWS